MSKRSPFRYFNISPEIIGLTVMLYVRFPLSLRNIENLLHERGIDEVRVYYEVFQQLRWRRWGGCRSPVTASRCAKLALFEPKLKERASMDEVTTIGINLAKNVFQLHGAAADGSVVFRNKLSRPHFQRFMSEHPRCVVAMEARGGAYRWARENDRLGDAARLSAPPQNAADAEASVEAALHTTMSNRAAMRTEWRGLDAETSPFAESETGSPSSDGAH